MAPPRRAIKSNVLEVPRATNWVSVWMSGPTCGLQILKVVVRWDVMTLFKLLLKSDFFSSGSSLLFMQCLLTQETKSEGNCSRTWRRKVETENWKGLKREKNRGSREIDVEILRAARASFLRCQFWGWFAKDSYRAFRASSDFFSFLSPSFKAPLWLVSIFDRKACFK